MDDAYSNNLREPPSNVAAEKGLLGAILINNRAMDVCDGLLSEHFAYRENAMIYEACLDLIEKNRVADPISLINHFKGQDDATYAGVSNEYLTRLAASAVTVINARDYARTIKGLYHRRRLIDAGLSLVESAHEPGGTEAQAIQEAHEAELFNLAAIGEREGGPRAISDYVTRAVAQARAARESQGVVGVSTGLADLDEKLGGLQNTDLLIIAARPAMGKTALATTMAINAAEAGIPGLVFSLEMAGDQLALREIAKSSNTPSHLLRSGRTNATQILKAETAGASLSSLPLHIDDRAALSIQSIRSTARRMKRKHDIKFIIVDYLQLATDGGRNRHDGRVQEISSITRGLKTIAKELGVPVIALSQLSRQVEQRDDKRPQLSDLRESGSIEQDADVVMFIYRDEYYLEKSEPSQRDSESDVKFLQRRMKYDVRLDECRGVAEIIIAKQRHGPTGTVKLFFDGDRTTFQNIAGDR